MGSDDKQNRRDLVLSSVKICRDNVMSLIVKMNVISYFSLSSPSLFSHHHFAIPPASG